MHQECKKYESHLLINRQTYNVLKIFYEIPFKLGIAPTLSNEQPGLQYQYSSIGQSNEFEKDSQMHDVENIQILDPLLVNLTYLFYWVGLINLCSF